MARVIRKPGQISHEQLKIVLAGLDGKRGKVGWFEGSKYPDGTPVAYVAAINEFGRNARPFIRPAITAHRAEWARIAEQGSKAVAAGRADIGQVMEAIGLRAVGDIQKMIASIFSPALKDSTIAARRRHGINQDKPLEATHLMFDTITNVVEESR